MESVEEYLETLYTLTREGIPAKTGEIASSLRISQPSVTEMLRKLSKEGYIEYTPYHGVMLTKKGSRRARKIKRKHRLLERFLWELGVRERIHEQACRMEHVLSDDAEEALCRKMNYPDLCPDNKLIPLCEKDVQSCGECGERKGYRREELFCMKEMKDGEKGRIAFLRGGKDFLEMLSEKGLRIGMEIKVRKMKMDVEVETQAESILIPKQLALKIWVRKK
jgi:DtxR family Mn-dependent transcriptional regulator